MKKEDYDVSGCYNIETFQEYEDDHIFIVGFKDGDAKLDDITDDWRGDDRYVNNSEKTFKTPDELEEYYNKEFDFYFIFTEDDEREVFVDDNDLNL